MEAAESHTNGVHDKMGSDPFKWALLICIGHRCLKEQHKANHGFTFTEEEVREWALAHGQLGEHDGDYDYLAMVVGEYDSWVRRGVDYCGG